MSPRRRSFVADVADATLIAHCRLLALQLCLPYTIPARRLGCGVCASEEEYRHRERGPSETKPHLRPYSTYHYAKTKTSALRFWRLLAKRHCVRDRLPRELREQPPISIQPHAAPPALGHRDDGDAPGQNRLPDARCEVFRECFNEGACPP
jgi:hypothetical protein